MRKHALMYTKSIQKQKRLSTIRRSCGQASMKSANRKKRYMVREITMKDVMDYDNINSELCKASAFNGIMINDRQNRYEKTTGQDRDVKVYRVIQKALNSLDWQI